MGSGVPYGQVSSAHLQAHNHLDPHQEDEELICKHVRRDKLSLWEKPSSVAK